MANNSVGYLERAFFDFFDRHNFCIPAKIIAVRDAKQRRIDVQPLPRKVYSTGEVIDYPVITSVQAVSPSTSQTMIHLPLVVGDLVLLVFSQEEIDDIKTGVVEQYTPDTRRKLDLSDAIAIVGLFGFNSAPENTATRYCNYGVDDVAVVHNLGESDECSFVLSNSGAIVFDANSYTFKRGKASFEAGVVSPSYKDKDGKELVKHTHRYYDDGQPKITSENL